MKSRTTDPNDITAVQRRFQAWRGQPHKSKRIPEPLWAAAVRLAQTHGVSRIAQILALGYRQLRDRVAQPRPTAAPQPITPGPFVEVSLDQVGSQAGCTTIELENGLGAKMTLRLSSPHAAEMVALAEAFWRRGR